MKKKSKDIVAERLDYLMKSNPQLGTQMKLAKKTGIGQTTIGRIRRGEVNATAENLRTIASAFDVPVGFFFDDDAVGWPDGATGRPASREGQLPLISWVQAGSWNETIDNFHPGDADQWIYCPFRHTEHAFILRVIGKSMYNPIGERSYNDGDYIVVDPGRQAINGSMVVARLNKEHTAAVFRQLLVEPNGEMMLMALNPAWPNRIIKVEHNIVICGVVIGKWTDET